MKSDAEIVFTVRAGWRVFALQCLAAFVAGALGGGVVAIVWWAFQ